MKRVMEGYRGWTKHRQPNNMEKNKYLNGEEPTMLDLLLYPLQTVDIQWMIVDIKILKGYQIQKV